MNRLIGLPVVQDGKRIGTVDAVSVARCGKRLAGLHVQGSWLRSGFVPAKDIRMLGGVCVLVEKLPGKRTEQFQLRRVRDTSGLRLGVVTDALVREQQLEIEAVEVSFGLPDDLLRGRCWVRSFTVDPVSGDVVAACGPWLDREGGTKS